MHKKRQQIKTHLSTKIEGEWSDSYLEDNDKLKKQGDNLNQHINPEPNENITEQAH